VRPCLDANPLTGRQAHERPLRRGSGRSCAVAARVPWDNHRVIAVARKAFVSSIVVVAVVVGALALWKLKLIIALLFLAFIVAAAMRPGVEALRARGVPRGFGILIHYIVLLALIGGLLWLAVPRAVNQVQDAIKTLPKTEQTAAEKKNQSFKHKLLVDIHKRLENLPTGSKLVRPAVNITVRAFEILVGIFFVLASAAYWIFEREKAERLVVSLLPLDKRKVVRDTWNLIDLKLGAFVRGQLILILLVGTVLSLAFWLIGVPYWILVGSFAGIVEIVPVIGPLAAGALAIGVGLTKSVGVGLAAGIAVLVVRLSEDYVIIPRVLGEAVGLSPLVVLVAVTTVGILFGGFAVLLAVPLAAVVATLIDVILLDKDPAKEEVPTVLFPAKDAETV
jgi:predicted PurR-regulated permease PerM